MKKTEYLEVVRKLAYYELMAASIGDITTGIELMPDKPLFVTLSVGKQKLLHFTFADTDSMSERGLLDTLHTHFCAQIDYCRKLLTILQADPPNEHQPVRRPPVIGSIVKPTNVNG